MDSFTKGNQKKCIKSLKQKHKRIVNNLNNGDVKIVNLFDSAVVEKPTLKIIESNALFIEWQNKIVRDYINNKERETLFPILTENEYVACGHLNYAINGLFELSSVENTIIEHDDRKVAGGDHNIIYDDTDDEFVIRIIPLVSILSYREISSVFFESDSKSKRMINKLYAKFPQTSALINKPLDQFNWKNAISKESNNTSCSTIANNYSNWKVPVNFQEKLYVKPPFWYHRKKFYDPILFNILYKKKEKTR